MHVSDWRVASIERAADEDALLLREFSHRTLNTLAIAEAVVRLVDRAAGSPSGSIVENALARIEGLGRVHRLLARPVPPVADLAGDIASLCMSLHEAATGSREGLSLDLCDAIVDGAQGRRLALVAMELVTNAHRHGCERGSGLRVGLDRIDGDLTLVVADEGRSGVRPATGGTGYGRGIVDELVARAGGVVAVERSGRGTMVRVTVPGMAEGGIRGI